MTGSARAAYPAGALTPEPGAAPWPRMLLAQARMELALILRNGEQILLNLIIPVLLTVVLVLEPVIEIGHQSRSGYFLPGVLALAVMSAAFTGLAIATGFERKYGMLKRLGATALPRSVLLLGKTTAYAVLQTLQIAVICLVGVAVG
ncbi:MAG: ABC transporter permease [Mycobacteriales bacterium]